MSEIVVVITGATGPAGTANIALDDLTDVTITAAASGDILRHNGTAWVDTPGTTHFEAAGAVSTHAAVTTNVHGIADTSVLLTTTDAPELIRDTIGTALTAGTGITITPNDGADTITIASTVGGVATDSIFDAKGDLAVGTGADTAARLAVGAEGTVPVATTNEAAGMKWAPPAPQPTFASSAVYLGPETGYAATTGSSASVAQVAYIYPKSVSRRLTLAALAIEVTTLEAGSTARVGVYSLDASWSTATKVAEYTSVTAIDCSSTGIKESTGSTALDPGWYALVVWYSNHSTVRLRKLQPQSATLFGNPVGALNRFVFGWKTAATDYSAGLPASFDLTALTLANTSTDANATYVGARFS